MEKLNIPTIKEHLRSLGYNQSDIAKGLAVSRESVSKWFKNEAYPRPAKLLQLAQYLNLDFDQLIITEPIDNEPVIAFRKKGSHKIDEQYIEHAKYTGQLLDNLVPYLPFDSFSRPSTLKEPKNEYNYIHSVANKIRDDLKLKYNEEVPFESIIGYFSDLHAVLVPVFWGAKNQHENALHIHLPKSMTSWIFLNLDTNILDFKFWMSHELGHMKAQDINGDTAEDFADAFASALLINNRFSEEIYNHLCTKDKSVCLMYINKIAKQLVVSPLTVYNEVNAYARYNKKPIIDLTKDNLIYKTRIIFNKEFPNVKDVLFEDERITVYDYIKSSKDVFKTPFFDVLEKYLKHNKDNAANFIKNTLHVSYVEAKEISEVLV